MKVYLDNLSSTPLLPEVLEAMLPWFRENCGNASALHQEGIKAKQALTKAREQIASFINAPSPDDIIFTGCGTEANNLAIKGVADAYLSKGNHIIISNAEHPSVENSVAFLEKHGWVVTRVPVDKFGFIVPETIRTAITEKTTLIATHYANHDIGTIQNIEQIGQIAKERLIPFFVDANFSAGWLPIDVQKMNASLLSLSPHRFYGPKGVGILYKTRKTRMTSLLHGGMQENNHRSGTENIPAIVGGGLAAEIAKNQVANRAQYTRSLQKKLWEELKKHIPDIYLNGPEPGETRHPSNLNISTKYIEGESQLLLLNAMGIFVASGSSCVSKNLKVSRTLTAIGLDITLAQGNLILSLGKDNTEAEIDYVIENFAKIVQRLREMSPTLMK